MIFDIYILRCRQVYKDKWKCEVVVGDVYILFILFDFFKVDK